MDLVDRVTEYYAARAPEYDVTAGYTDPVAEQLRAPMKARYHEMFKGHDVLEIACGTGYWTEVVGEVVNSVLAIDINPSVVAIAQDRCRHLSSVDFQVTDAYSLGDVPTGFTAALAIWWWSHMPKGQISAFLSGLHRKLTPGALVLFVDQLAYEGAVRRRDPEGNTLEQRSLPDGRSFWVVKNFPTGYEVTAALEDIAENVRYLERPEERSWNVTYNTRS